MKSKLLLFFTLVLLLVVNACSPVAIATSSGEQPTPVIETSPTAGYQPVDVNQSARHLRPDRARPTKAGWDKLRDYPLDHPVKRPRLYPG
jgi:hypothetical protein